MKRGIPRIDRETGVNLDGEAFMEELENNWDEWAGDYLAEHWQEYVEWVTPIYEKAYPTIQQFADADLVSFAEVNVDKLLPDFIQARVKDFEEWCFEKKWRE